MRPPLQSAPFRAIIVLAIVTFVTPCSIATANPILANFKATLSQPGFSDAIDLGVTVDGGVEIDNASGTNVGLLFFPDEFVDVTNLATSTRLVYQIQGGGDLHSEPGYRHSWPAGTTLLFSSFVLDQPGTLASVSVATNKVVGDAGGLLDEGVDYLFTDTSLLLNIGLLGILEGGTQLGQMTFQLNFVANQPVSPVPDAASSSTLFGMALAALAARRRFERRRQ